MNTIIKKYNEEKAEEKQFRQTQLCALSEYCKIKRPLNIEELIYEEVNKVDTINYQFERVEIPKMHYPKMKHSRITDHVFFNKLLP